MRRSCAPTWPGRWTASSALAERLRDKERAYGRASRAPAADVHWFDDAATDATVARDPRRGRIGLLYRITAALERGRAGRPLGARVSSLGGSVVDAFYVTDPAAAGPDPARPGRRRHRGRAPPAV